MRGAACLLLPWLLGAPSFGAEDRVATLTRASLVLDAGERPPADDDPRWQHVRLPDEWRTRRPERSGFAWYRLEMPARKIGDERLAVYLASVGMNAAVWVNGRPIGSGGSFEDPVARNFNRPLLFPFSRALLGRGPDVLHVRLFCYDTPHHGYLGPVAVGPAEPLERAYSRRLFWQVRLAELATWLAVVMLAFVSAIWLATGRQGLYGWFVLATGFWILNSLNYWVREPPVGTWSWERLVNAPIEGLAVALALWSHRLLGIRLPRVERVLLAFGALAIATTFALPREQLYPTALWLHLGAMLVGLYAVVRVCLDVARLPGWLAGVYFFGGLACLGLAVHDLALQLGIRPATSPSLLSFAIPVLMVPFGATLTARFVTSLRAAEAFAGELEQRVEEKTAELEHTHARARLLERERVLSEERERIMREMHDGLGGQLVSALSLAEAADAPPELAPALRSALEEMRTVIDSLDPKVSDLGQLLGQVRGRLAPVAERSGLRLVWDVGRERNLPTLGPGGSLHVLRILQEAITNAVKHSGGSEIVLSLRAGSSGGASIAVRDDGGGRAAARSGGRGLAHMRERAARLGATLRIEDASPGTRVELSLPSDPPGP
ncbi:MAG: sensor histidine kinase [Myxococcales bacterium]|nr:sensor histidine kinase [Myxococcales bacterium]